MKRFRAWLLLRKKIREIKKTFPYANYSWVIDAHKALHREDLSPADFESDLPHYPTGGPKFFDPE